MAKISELTPGGSLVATDQILALRSGGNVRVTLGNMVAQSSDNVAITGGVINNTVIGGITRAAGSFTAVVGTTGAFSGTVTVGANGTIRESSDDLHVGNGITNIRFFDTEDRVIPVLADGTPSDAGTSLGRTTHRFKDILLSGVVSAGTATISGVVTIGDGHTIGDDAFDNLVVASSAGENLILDGKVAVLFYEDGAEVGRFDGGKLSVPAGILLGGTAAANLLNVYTDLLTYTPSFHNFGTGTYAVRVGRYSRVGKTVTVQVHLDVATLGSASGAVSFSLPLVASTAANYFGTSGAIHAQQWTTAVEGLNVLVDAGTNRASLYYNAGKTVVADAVTHAIMGTGNLVLTVQYFTD
jgi:hypothetical protein